MHKPHTSSFVENVPLAPFLDLAAQDLYMLADSQAEAICGGTATEVRTIPETPTHEIASLSANPAIKSNNWSQELQQVLDQPPAAFPRWLFVGGLVFCLAFGAWTWLGKIEQVGHARGRMIPKSDVYKINPVDLGKVTYIAVKEGEKVKAGQLLVEMDTEIALNQVTGLKQQLAAYEVELNQKQGLINSAHLEASNRQAIAAAEIESRQQAIAAAKTKVTTTRQLLVQLQAQVAANQTKLEMLAPLKAAIQKRLAQQQVDVAAAQSRISRLEPLVKEGAISQLQVDDAQQTLRDRHEAITESELQEAANTKERLFESEQALRDSTSAITQKQGELQQALVEVQQLQAELAQKQAEAKTSELESQQQIQQMQVELTQIKAKIADTRSQLNSAMEKVNQGFFYAPVSGIVSSLNVHNIGEVVQPGQTLAEVAPETAPLIVSANLPNQEAGFVKTGMPVRVKLDAYPYQDYGVISGKVISVSPDTKQDQQLGPVYQVKIALDRNYVTAHNQTIPFKAGETATADIIIRHRRIIDVLLEPITKLQKGGMNL